MLTETKDLNQKIKTFLGEKYDKVMESEGKALNSLPWTVSHNFSSQFSKEIIGLLYNVEGISEDEEFQTIQKIYIETQIIKTKQEKASQALKVALEKIKSNNLLNLTPEELEEIEDSVINGDTTPAELIDNSSVLENLILKTYSVNAAISSQLIQEDSTLEIEEVEATNPRAALHVRKVAYDQICLLVFGSAEQSYSKSRVIQEIGKSSILGGYLGDSLEEEVKLFGYIDMKKLGTPNFTKYATLVSKHDGQNYSIQDVHHEVKELKVECEIAGKKVFVKLPISFGVIITTLADKNTVKSLDLNKELDSSVSRAVVKSEARGVSKHYVEIFNKLATATSENYSDVIRSLRK